MSQVLLTTRGDLSERLGGDCRPLRAELLRLAQAWAAAVEPERPAPVVAPELLPAAAREAFATGGGPVLVACAEVPRLGPVHARMALADLADGAHASFGPGMDGGWYVVALAGAHDELLALLGEDSEAPELMTWALGVARSGELEIGLLRMERVLRTPRDAAALLADPLTPEAVRTALRRMGWQPHRRPARHADL